MPPTSYRHHYTLRDLQLLVEDTQVLKQMDSELLDDYYHEFLAISNSLLEDDWLSSRRRDSLYLQGFPKAFRSQVLQRLSQTRPSVLSYEVYDFQDVHSAALFLLSENSSGSRQQDISKLREEIANLVKLVSANAETPQFFPSTTPGGVVQNPPSGDELAPSAVLLSTSSTTVLQLLRIWNKAGSLAMTPGGSVSLEVILYPSSSPARTCRRERTVTGHPYSLAKESRAMAMFLRLLLLKDLTATLPMSKQTVTGHPESLAKKSGAIAMSLRPLNLLATALCPMSN